MLDTEKNHKNQGIQVISRAADILRVLGKHTDGLSLGQIAGQANLPRSTVQRIVAALSVEGFITVEKGPGGIKLGPEIQALAQATAADMREELRPVMKAMSAATGETVDLAILEGPRMRFVDQVVGSQRLRTFSSIGETFPLTTTANGKAALACLTQAEAQNRIELELKRQVDPQKSVAALMDEIDTIREGALASDENEHSDGVCALGFAVQDHRGEIYAISIPVPATRYPRVKTMLADVLQRYRQELGR